MATGVGLRIAANESVVAIVTNDTDTALTSAAPVASEGAEPHFIVRDTVLHMSEDGDAELGGEPPFGHDRSITGFITAIGDPKGIRVDDGEAYRAEDLVATALFCLINLAADYLSGPAEFYAAHPSEWLAQQVQALREALDYLGLRSVILINEDDLPGGGGSGREVAAAAARAALSAVLATPAGITPPDPARAENSLVVTDILPALSTPEPAQAYSAAIPAATTATTAQPVLEPVPTTADPITAAPPTRRSRIGLLIAGAVVIGLLLGGIGVGLLARSHTATTVQPPDARSGPATTTTTLAAPPPAPTADAPPVREIDTPAPATSTVPSPTATSTPAPTTPAPTPETTAPSSTLIAPTPAGQTSPPYPTNPYQYQYPYTYDPYNDLPLPPAMRLPQVPSP